MQIQNHIFKEDYTENRTRYINGKKDNSIDINIKGQSEHIMMNNINVFNTQHLDKEPKIVCDIQALDEYCNKLSEGLEAVSDQMAFYQVSVVTINREVVIETEDGKKISKTENQGRIFGEVNIKHNDEILGMILQVGRFSLENEWSLRWWEQMDTDAFLSHFYGINEYLNSQQIQSGNYDIILSPKVSGIMAHEIFGHIFERDSFKYNIDLIKAIMQGAYNKMLNVADEPLESGGWGLLEYDDAGYKQERKTIIEDGRVSEKMIQEHGINRLRREHYGRPLLSRVSNTIILPGDIPVEELWLSIKDGIYIKTINQCYCEPVTGEVILPVYEAYRVKNGKKVHTLRPFKLYVNIVQILKSIEYVANDYEVSGTMCGKMGQTVPVGVGAPSLLLRNIPIM